MGRPLFFWSPKALGESGIDSVPPPPDPPCFFFGRSGGRDIFQAATLAIYFWWIYTGGRAAPPDPPCFFFGRSGGRNRFQAATLAIYFWWIYMAAAITLTLMAAISLGTGHHPWILFALHLWAPRTC